jgi:hypothetical protein
MKLVEIHVWRENTCKLADELAAGATRNVVRFIANGWECYRMSVSDDLRHSILLHGRVEAVRAHMVALGFNFSLEEMDTEVTGEVEESLNRLMNTDPVWTDDALSRFRLFALPEPQERVIVPLLTSVRRGKEMGVVSTRRCTKEPCPSCKAEPQPYEGRRYPNGLTTEEDWDTRIVPITYYSYDHAPDCSVSQLVRTVVDGYSNAPVGTFYCLRCKTWTGNPQDGVEQRSMECPFCWAELAQGQPVHPVLQTVLRTRGLHCNFCNGTGVSQPGRP